MDSETDLFQSCIENTPLNNYIFWAKEYENPPIGFMICSYFIAFFIDWGLFVFYNWTNLGFWGVFYGIFHFIGI